MNNTEEESKTIKQLSHDYEAVAHCRLCSWHSCHHNWISLLPSLQALQVSLLFSCCSFSTAAYTCHLSLVPKVTGVWQPPLARSAIQAALYPHFPQCILLPHLPLVSAFQAAPLTFPMSCRLPLEPLLGLLPCQGGQLDSGF